jgi:DNA-binding LacI/PurR family transcriptional regulator
MREAGAEIVPDHVQLELQTEEDAYRAADRLFDGPIPPTAVIAGTTS